MKARLLLIDNYDSFTWNLVQAFEVLGAEVRVVRNDAITVPQALALRPSHLCISQGPGTPAESGVSPTQPEGAGSDGGEAVNDAGAPQDPFAPGEADRIAAEHASAATGSASGGHPDTALAAERLGDLQRLQAEYAT